MKKSKIKTPVIILLLAAFVYSSCNPSNRNAGNNTTDAGTERKEDHNSGTEPRTPAGSTATSPDSVSTDAQNPANPDK